MVLTPPRDSPPETAADATAARLVALRDRQESADDSSQELGRILFDEAAPILAATVKARLSDFPFAEQEEVQASALLRLTEILQRFVAGDPEIEIRNFRAYVSATGANACRAFLRQRHPERTRLGNQLRYVLGHDPGLALWTAADGSLQCGLAGWNRRQPADFPPVSAATPELSFVAGESTQPMPARLPSLLKRYFLAHGRPVRLNQLLGTMSDALGVVDRQAVSIAEASADDPDESPPEIAETRPGADRQLEDRQYLERLWDEVAELPIRQRTALLLNLRDDQGRDRLRLFPLTGVTDLSGIARCLGVGVDELQELLPTLPLDDRTIAERLAATPRQVINLRKSARARLARRLGRGRQESGPDAGR